MDASIQQLLGLFACLLITALLIVSLWAKKTDASVLMKVLWSVFFFVPLVGWICYLFFFNFLPEQSKDCQCFYSGDGVGALLSSIKRKRLDKKEE